MPEGSEDPAASGGEPRPPEPQLADTSGPPESGRDAKPASRIASSRLVGAAIVLVFAAIAVAAPAKIIARHIGSGSSGSGAVVTMAGLRFTPTTLTVPQGTAVVFNDNDVAPHTVTADDGSVDSGTISPGGTFRLTLSRRLAYHCTIHPFMKAVIEISG